LLAPVIHTSRQGGIIAGLLGALCAFFAQFALCQLNGLVLVGQGLVTLDGGRIDSGLRFLPGPNLG
jgi:hypothetical protein